MEPAGMGCEYVLSGLTTFPRPKEDIIKQWCPDCPKFNEKWETGYCR
jgi:hypothetical protein